MNHIKSSSSLTKNAPGIFPEVMAVRLWPGAFVVFAGLLLMGTPPNASANSITINFDSVDASAGGVDPTAYLAAYGITLSGVSPSPPLIYSDQDFYGNGTVVASSGDNFLEQQSAVYGGSFTLNFSVPLTALQFTRIASLTPNSVGVWTATAYSGGTALSTVGEPNGGGSYSPAIFSFTGTDITSLTVSGNGYGSAGISSVMMDDLILTPVSGAAPVSQLAVSSFGLSGANVVISGTNAGAGTFYVLMSTNLAQPVSQWTPAATNVLSASGSFTFTATNAVNPSGTQQYYILSTTNN